MVKDKGQYLKTTEKGFLKILQPIYYGFGRGIDKRE